MRSRSTPWTATVTSGSGVYFRAGDVVRSTATGEAYRVTTIASSSLMTVPVPLWRSLVWLLTRRRWIRREQRMVDLPRLRGFTGPPSPLPRRLP